MDTEAKLYSSGFSITTISAIQESFSPSRIRFEVLNDRGVIIIDKNNILGTKNSCGLVESRKKNEFFQKSATLQYHTL